MHEQALQRLTEATGLVPVEYPTTRQLGASPEARAADVTAAFADPSIRAVLTTIGGDDQVTVTPHIDAEVVASNPKPFLGYSDNTNLHNLLWGLGVPSYYAARRRCTSVRDHMSTRCTWSRSARRCSTAA